MYSSQRNQLTLKSFSDRAHHEAQDDSRLHFALGEDSGHDQIISARKEPLHSSEISHRRTLSSYVPNQGHGPEYWIRRPNNNQSRDEETNDNPAASSLNFANEIQQPIDFFNKEEIRDETQTVTSTARSIVWPAIAISVPIGLLSAGLLSVIFINQIKPGASIFGDSELFDEYRKQPYLLVDFSATQIVFLASFLSTIAPLLTGCIMSLTTILVCGRLRKDSQPSNFPLLPTPHQMSLLAGVLSASYEYLYMSFRYMISKHRKTSLSPILRQSSFIFIFSVFLALAVSITDGVLHYVTSTANFVLYDSPTQPSYYFGRRLNDLCSHFNRTELNFGFPCTWNVAQDLWDDKDYYHEQLESQYISYNISTPNEIRHVQLPTDQNRDIAILIPRGVSIPKNLDFEANTVGVSSRCRFIPPSQCNISSWGPNSSIYTRFNCSRNFWGELGMNPNVTEMNSYRSPSPHVSFLATKTQANLQYGFFSDTNLENVYNPAGLNDSAMPDPSLYPLNDSELVNPLYMAFAWRTSYKSLAGGNTHEMGTSPMVAHYESPRNWLEYFVKCEIRSYDVSYVWSNGTIKLIKASLQENGTVLNMWQGAINGAGIISVGRLDLNDMNLQSTIAGRTIVSYEDTFSQLISEPALGLFGGYSSSTLTVRQQNRHQVLLAKIPKGLAAAAWCGIDDGNYARMGSSETLISSEPEDTTRLYVDGDVHKGFRFGLWKRSKDGAVIDIQRTQTDIPTFI